MAMNDTVMVVEDDSTLRNAIGDLLGEEGMSATRACAAFLPAQKTAAPPTRAIAPSMRQADG